MSMVCLDTQVLTWAMQQVHGQSVEAKRKPEDEDLRQRAASLIERLVADGTPIGLPAVVVAEFLCIIPEVKHQAVLGLLAKTFMLLPFDGAAAIMFASLFRERQAEVAKEGTAPKGGGPTRTKMKVDLLIVATSVQAKASTIYSHDPDLKRFARGRIPVQEMPPRPATQLVIPAVEEKPAGSFRIPTST